MTDESIRRWHILVVDDDEGMRALLRIMLARAGYEVTLAIDGLDALRKIAERRPDVVLSDVMMPNLDGFGLLERVRANPDTRSLPFILLTARSASADMAEGYGLGACEYLVKPVTQAAMQIAIQKSLVPADIILQDV
jgi:two-component system, OmpR family, phosphate regulon response regulator PhoB